MSPQQQQEKDLPGLLEGLEQLADYRFEGDAEQQRASLAARRVADRLQKPYDKILEMWGGPSKDAALKVGIDVGLWRKWKEGKWVQTAGELAELTGVDPALMAALLKHLATWNIINEDGPNTYSPTVFSEQLARPEIAACVTLQYEAFIQSFYKLPEFVKAHSYTRPSNPTSTPFSRAYNTSSAFWDYCGEHPSCGECFGLTMQGYNADRGTWMDVYPPAEIVNHAADDETPLLVDVGGGSGHDLEKFRRMFPEKSRGRLVLQDMEYVIEGAKENVDEGIKPMVHDFFTEQPVKNARAYFLHSIAHDWPDAAVRSILQKLKPAMKRGYSKLLINEMVGGATGAVPNFTTFDMIMMGVVGGRERDEQAWRKLVESVEGLRVVRVWGVEGVTEGVIEVEVV